MELGKMIRITVDNEMTVHDFPEGTGLEQNKKIRELIGPKCSIYEHVMPQRLYTELGAGRKCTYDYGQCANMFVDEEGYYHDLPVNVVGSWLYETDKHGYPILGTILVAGEYLSEYGEINFSGLSEEQFQTLYPKLKALTEKARKIL